MRLNDNRRLILQTSIAALLVAVFCCGVCLAGEASEWAYLDSSGKLAYRALPTGDHIMDFSFAGYGGGGVAIPDVATKITVNPGGDDSANIQKAIDEVSNMTLINGQRGAVELAPGDYNCARAINIATSGVVLRGSDGTVLHLTGDPHWAVLVKGTKTISEEGHTTLITDTYIPSGADSFEVADTAGLEAGDTIQITRPVTESWVRFMGMGDMVRNGKPEHWLSGKLQTERVIQQISGHRITVTVPLSDSYDSQYLNPPGSTVVKINVTGLITQVGVEHLRIESPPQPIEITAPQFQAVGFDGVTDSWARDLEIHDTIGSIWIDPESTRLTIQRVNVTHSVPTKGAALAADFGGAGSQLLFDRCSATGDHLFYFATFGRTQGPNVLLNCTFHGDGTIQPHQRWSTGLLVDGCQVPTSGIELKNRGIMGSGHGWTIGWAVAWNCMAKYFVVQQPPGATNWVIGCSGAIKPEARPGGPATKLPDGISDSPNVTVKPESLYLEQLRERLGDEAVKNIGY